MIRQLFFIDNCSYERAAKCQMNKHKTEAIQFFSIKEQAAQFNDLQGVPKKLPNLLLSELHQVSTKFGNFWHTDSQDDRNM